jgi:hypothetical protein
MTSVANVTSAYGTERVGTTARPPPMLNGYRSPSLMRPIAGSKAAHWTRLAVAQLAKSTLDALAHMIERRDADPVAHHVIGISMRIWEWRLNPHALFRAAA